ncbi:MAG: cyclic-di-AMP receptor [Chloroflexi bacterium]|nr:cyclic-di-AMP receptor [Chloroflexota bacterium]
MKLVLAIVHREDAGKLVDALTEKGHRATRLNTAGGFLKEGNATILVGMEEDQLEQVLALIRDSCHTRTQYVNPLPPIMEPGEFYMPYPVEVQLGGATVFVLNVERYERL